MKQVVLIVSCLVITSCMQASSVVKVERPPISAMQEPDERVATFQAKFLKWKKTLTLEQKEYFDDLFDAYYATYLSYRKNPDAYTTQLILHQIDTINAVMQHWDTFYAIYLKYQLFYQQFTTWKNKLSVKKHHALYKELVDFQDVYDQYEHDPVSQENQVMMEKKYKAMKKLMQKQ